MDKLNKTLKRLNKVDRLRATAAIEKIESGDVLGFDIKPLKGSANLYRLREGNLRIFFTQLNNIRVVTEIRFRSEKTYRDI